MAETLKDMLAAEKKVDDKKTRDRDKLRKKRADDSKTLYLVFIRSMCPNRTTVRKCKNYHVVIERDSLTMRCESILGTKREWVFMLDKFFKPGIVTLEMTEKWFNLMMLKIACGPFEVQKKRVVMNRRNVVEFSELAFEEVSTWSQREDYST